MHLHDNVVIQIYNW